MSAHPELTASDVLRVGAPGRSRAAARRLTLDTQWRAFTIALLVLDALMLGLAFAAAYYVRFVLEVSLAEPTFGGDITFYTTVVMALIPTWLLIFLVAGLYEESNLLGGTREYALVFNGVSAGMLLVVAAAFLEPEFIIARGWLILAWLLAFVFVSAARFGSRRLVYRLRGRGYFLSPTLIVGANDEAASLAHQLVAWRSSGLDVLGFVATEPDSDEACNGLQRLGTLPNLTDIVAELGIRDVVVATSALRRAELVEVFREFGPREDVELRLSSGLYEVMTTGLTIKEAAYVPLVVMHPTRLTGIDRVLKAVLDLTVALSVIIVASPLYLAVALTVKATSPGPVVHRRRVLGQGGRYFDCFKFRTMAMDGAEILAAHPELEAELARNHKLKDDPRLTRIGPFLRRTSLDELPQMFNVLRGQMSVVGPRMISPEEHARYGQWDMNLLTLKPGITGLWQVSGRSETTYEERVQLDMNYIRNWTIWLDLQILVQTIPAVVRGRGAY